MSTREAPGVDQGGSGFAAVGGAERPVRGRVSTRRPLRWARRGSSRAPGGKKWLLGGPVILALLVLAALIGPHWLTEPALTQSLEMRLLPPLALESGQLHILGTDHLGRDVFARLVLATRSALLIGMGSVILAAFVGATLGLFAGFYRGIVGAALMRLVDLQMAFPFTLLAMAMVSIVGASVLGIVFVFMVTSWPTHARLVRGVALSVREREYVDAAVAAGASDWRIIRRHIAPACLGALMVLASYEMARLVITEAALGYLGVGIKPPTPTWGNMLADGRGYMQSATWLTLFPGAAIFLLAMGVNLTAELIETRIG